MLGVILLVIFCYLARRWLDQQKFCDIPGPSPWLSLPLIGHGYMLGKRPADKLLELQRKYGEIFRLDLGKAPTVIICKYGLAKEAFFKDAFNGRFWNEIPTLRASLDLGQDGQPILGTGFSDGKLWNDQRKFLMKTLSNLGMGKKDTMQDIVEQEADEFAGTLKRRRGQPVQSRGMFMTATNNVIWRLATGKSSRQDDPELVDLTNKVKLKFQTMDPSKPWNLLQLNSVAFAKMLRYLGLPNFLYFTKAINDKLEKEVEASEPDAGGNYIERALSEGEEDPNSRFGTADGKKYLTIELHGLFVAGTDTTATTLEWIILYLLKNPDAQERIHEELKSLTGENSRKITLQDKSNTHFTNSFIDEVTRHSKMATLAPPHKMLDDSVVGGKRIPNGCQVFFFGHGINMDGAHFEAPGEFRPDRFLDESGFYDKDERVIFFGVGKRRCPGELLARAEVFLFVASLVQQFRLVPVKRPEELSTEIVPGLIFSPVPYEFRAEERD